MVGRPCVGERIILVDTHCGECANLSSYNVNDFRLANTWIFPPQDAYESFDIIWASGFIEPSGISSCLDNFSRKRLVLDHEKRVVILVCNIFTDNERHVSAGGKMRDYWS